MPKQKKDKQVTRRLDEHNETIAGHTETLEGHATKLDEHTGELDMHRHQLKLTKVAMDKDMAGGLYAYRRTKGTERDMLRDWNPENPRKTESQEGAENNSQGSSPRSQRSDSTNGRRRLASNSALKSHTAVLEALLEEISGQN